MPAIKKAAPKPKPSSKKKSSPVVQVKKTKSAKGAPKHPSYIQMIEEAVASADNKKGLSRQKIVSYLESNYGLSVESGVVKAHIKRALSTTVEEGNLLQDKNTFRMTAAQKRAVIEDSPELKGATKPKKTPAKQAKKVTESQKKAAASKKK